MMRGGLICGGVDWGADKKFCEKKFEYKKCPCPDPSQNPSTHSKPTYSKMPTPKTKRQ